MALGGRQKISVDDIQYREKRPETTKIIVISCEGPVTEKIHFNILSDNIFQGIKSKINIISVREEYNSIERDLRIQKDVDDQNKSTYYVKSIKSAGAKMKGKGSKKPHAEDFTKAKVNMAIQEAKKLNENSDEKWPCSLGSTVYLLVEKMLDMLEGV